MAIILSGRLIHVQWVVLSDARDQLMLPTNSLVPKEASLLQLWKKFIASRCKGPAKKISWGKHYRGGVEIEEGTVTSLEEADMVEVIVKGKKKKDGMIEVAYTIGEEAQVYRIWVKDNALVDEVKRTIALAHKGKPITKLAFEGAELADEDAFSDWMTRSGGMPRQIQAKLSRLVQVILDWMGAEQQMFARECWMREEFAKAVQAHLGISHKIEVTPLGLSDWEVRASFVYEIKETRKMELRCRDINGRKTTIGLAGNKTIEDVKNESQPEHFVNSRNASRTRCMRWMK
jgi:hypothetical protein